MKIAVLGAGVFGSALAGVLSEKSYAVALYDPILKNKLSDCLEGAEMMILAAPSAALPELLPKLPKELPLIIATKGVLNEAVFADFKDYMVLSGPGYATDIVDHKKTLLTATDQRIIDIFTTDYLTFEYTNDVRGVLMCGALKNTYAILAGFLNLKIGELSWKEFINEVVDEMRELLDVNGANSSTVDLACGRKDLEITCKEPSRNYDFGQKLRENPEYLPQNTAEGITALKRVKNGAIIVPENAVKLRFLMENSDKWA